MTKYVVSAARALASLGLIILAIWYVRAHWNDLAILFTVRWLDVIGLSILVVLFNFVSAAQFASLCRALGAKMNLFESYGLSSLASALNLVLPAQIGGMARAIYLKSQYAVPYSQAPAVFLGRFILSSFLGGLLVLLFGIVFTLMGEPMPLELWIGAAFAVMPAVLFGMRIPEQVTLRLGRIGVILRLFSDGWRSLSMDRRCLIESSIFQLLMFAVGGWAIKAAYEGLGLDVSLTVAISMAVFTSVSNMVIITPGNIGIQEVVMGYLSQLSGLSFVQGIAGAALLRAIGLIITFLVAPGAWYLLFYRLKISVPWLHRPKYLDQDR